MYLFLYLSDGVILGSRAGRSMELKGEESLILKVLEEPFQLEQVERSFCVQSRLQNITLLMGETEDT